MKSRGKASKKKQTKGGKHKNINVSRGGNCHGSWLEKLKFESIDGPVEETGGDATACGELNQLDSVAGLAAGSDLSNAPDRPAFSIISWNVLAEAFCNYRSQRCLPNCYQRVVFSPKRLQILKDILRHFIFELSVDIFCLQEVDMDVQQVIHPIFSQAGFACLEAPRAGKDDTVTIYVKTHPESSWQLTNDHQVIQLDDLATLSTAAGTKNEDNKIYSESSVSKVATSANNLQGLQLSFMRRNKALMVRLRHVPTGRTVVLINAHLYWQPRYEYVKVCQAHYIMLRAQEFCHDNEELLFCGDFNSCPSGPVHTYLSSGSVSARNLAPWYHSSPYFKEYGLNPAAKNAQGKPRKQKKKKSTLATNVQKNSEKITVVERLQNDDTVNNHNSDCRSTVVKVGEFTDDDLCKKETNEVSEVVDGENVYHDSRDYVGEICASSNEGVYMNTKTSGTIVDAEEDSESRIDPKFIELSDSNDDKNDDKVGDWNDSLPTDVIIDNMIDDDVVEASCVDEQVNIDSDEDASGVHDTDGTHLINDIFRKQFSRDADMTTAPPSQVSHVRYILDATLNKLCRWLRILGQDCALETEEEERLRTKESKMIIFERCLRERRALVTTSTRLMLRNNCPPGTYCINPNILPNLEVAMVHLFLTHGIVLEPRKFLTRCVVCNGAILLVNDPELRNSIYQAPNELTDDMEVYQCDGCLQGYWWCELPTSSASRVKNTATRLFQLCLQAGVPISGELGFFDFIDVDAERQKGCDNLIRGNKLFQQRLDVVDWMKLDSLECPVKIQSAYALKNTEGNVIGESLPFTNVTRDFVDTLDYIFVSNGIKTLDRLYVPTHFDELNTVGLKYGYLLPSDVWPSDHLAIGCRVELTETQTLSCINKSEVGNFKMTEPSNSSNSVVPICMEVGNELLLNTSKGDSKSSNNHGRLCNCGCVPNIPSLFKMADLRKQAKLSKQMNTL